MNSRRGFTRLAIALGVPYFGWWALTAYFGYTALPRYLAESNKASKEHDWESVTFWMTLANEADAAVQRSVMWGIFYPILAAIVAAIGYWVYRGFRPKQ